MTGPGVLRDRSVVESSYKGPSLVPSTHIAVHNCLCLVPWDLMPSPDLHGPGLIKKHNWTNPEPGMILDHQSYSFDQSEP